MSDPITRLNAALAGRYRIERKLGEGGMATVYLAEDLKHERNVALKVLKPELAAVVGAERFLAEIKTTANLNHPHILPLHDSGEADGFLFYAMPHVEGESLRTRLDRERQLPVEEAVRIAAAVAHALDYAHRHGFIHRDIKPGNVLLQDGEPVVADFGIALAVGEMGGNRVTETGLSLGTPCYMSPEQATGDQKVGPATDTYALGCVLYEMLVGEPPFTGSTAQAVLGKVIAGAPESVTAQRKSVPANVGAATAKALEKLPADRFARATEFAQALTNRAFSVATVGSSIAPTNAGSNWKLHAFIPLVSVTVAALAVAFWALMGPDPPRAVARFVLGLPAGQELAPAFGPHVAIAPDGSRFAYIGRSEQSVGQVWIRERDQLAATPLPGTEGACCLSFSPDGQAIAFGQQGSFKVVSLAGGPPVTLSDSVFPGEGTGGVDWGPDGSVYIAHRGLLRVPSTGGRLEVVTPQESSRRWHLWPDVLPNGKGALFTLGRNETWTANTIAVTDFATGEVRELTQGVTARFVAPDHLVYVRADGVLLAAPFDQNRMELTGPATPIAVGLGIRRWGATDLAISEEGTLLYTTGAHEPSRQVVWVTRGGVATPVDSEWSGPFESLSLSPDGRRLAIATGFGAEPQVRVKSLDTGPLTTLTFEGSLNRRPRWTPDGQAVMFVSDRGHNRDLYVKRADGVGAAEPVMDLAVHVDEGFWSPQGDWLVYRTGISGGEGRDIFAWRLADSVTVPVAADPGFDERSPTLSPDGRWLAYQSDESGRWEVYVRSFPDVDARRWQISARGGTAPAWAHNGRELFYKSGQHLMVVDVVTTPTFAPGQEGVLFSLAGYSGEYDMTADDQRFVMIRDVAAPVEGDLVIVQNFPEELEARSRN